ncbi:MAG: ADP-ribosylglycohydrolase family protein, partial [Armatimonadetes bacterium]|nr:ADP-ribosylglycohydrolase family protein [Armatimonadota bacterium]
QTLRSVTAESSNEDILSAHKKMLELQVAPDFAFDEPTEWEDIVQASPALRARYTGTPAADISGLDDRMLAAWLGRCAGCALGKPLERGPYMNGTPEIRGWQGIRIYLKAAKAWPLDDYVPDIGVVEEKFDVGCPDSTRGRIRFMETDDDIRYTVLGLKVLEDKGADFSTVDMAYEWLNTLPIGQTFTAERAAYQNLVEIHGCGISEKDIPWVRTHLNPFREWIGAQIRADGWGYGAAGRPALAAELAYRDAALSHVKNGIYGEMLMAATIAAAFVEESSLQALRAGVEFIPRSSRLYKDVLEAVELGLRVVDMDELHDELWKRWGHYDGVHTNNNAALVAAALAFGADDYEKTIVCAVTGGWDTDCNGATVGSVWGACYGAQKLPEKWTRPLNDTLYGMIPGFHPIAISECARRSAAVARKLTESSP